ncbi:MAG: hypothetical protein ACR2IV_07140 [Bryobacteraceae bacterium]
MPGLRAASRRKFSPQYSGVIGFGLRQIEMAIIKRMVGSAGTSRGRATLPDTAVEQAAPVPGQRTLNEPPTVSNGGIHPNLSVEQQAALVLAIQPAVIKAPITGVIENRLKPVWLCTAVFRAAASATFAVAYLRDRRSTAMVGVPHIIQEVPIRSARLGMRAQPQGKDLLLSWNAKSPALQSATDGLLQINDGPEHREVALDRGEIASASIVYRPVSENVVFRLEIRGPHGVHAAESVQVVGARSRAADFEAAGAPNVRDTGKTLSDGAVAERRGSKNIDAAKASSRNVNPASAKLGRAAVTATRPYSRPTLAPQKPPSLSVGSIVAAQPSALSGQELPKPPPQLSPAVRETAPTQEPNTAATARYTAGQNLGYVPPRPIKWAAPSAKSLGVSRISPPTDFEIKVRIDESGRVTAAHALLDRTRHDETVTAAVTAAVKKWIFEPAKMQGRNVASEETIVVRVDPRN